MGVHRWRSGARQHGARLRERSLVATWCVGVAAPHRWTWARVPETLGCWPSWGEPLERQAYRPQARPCRRRVLASKSEHDGTREQQRDQLRRTNSRPAGRRRWCAGTRCDAEYAAVGGTTWDATGRFLILLQRRMLLSGVCAIGRLSDWLLRSLRRAPSGFHVIFSMLAATRRSEREMSRPVPRRDARWRRSCRVRRREFISEF